MNTAKEIKIRAFVSKDIFALARILSDVGIKEFKDVIQNAREANHDESMTIEAIGFSVVIDAVGVIISNLDKAERNIYRFISSLTSEDVSTIENMPLNEFIQLLNEIIKQDDFTDFIKAVTSLLK